MSKSIYIIGLGKVGTSFFFELTDKGYEVNFVSISQTNLADKIISENNSVSVSLNIEKDLKFLNQAYPEIKIEFVVERGSFGPELLRELSARWRIPLNFMFIGSPGDKFPHSLSELGGVRLII